MQQIQAKSKQVDRAAALGEGVEKSRPVANSPLIQLRDFILKLGLSAIRPVLFYFINSKPFLLSSRYLMRLFDPKKDILVNVRGISMYANSLDRLLALLFWKFALVEGYEADLMKSLVSKNMRVVNCGANIGYYTLQLADWVGPQGEVYAFEPDPNSFRLLVKNAKANSIENLRALQYAVSHVRETRQLFFCEENRGDHRLFDSGDSRVALEVESISLDEFFPSGTQIDLIKMDIQGSEMQALRGMRRIIEENPEITIISEFCPTLLSQSGSSGKEYLEAIHQMGFEILFVDESKETVEKLDDETLLSICRSQYYCSIIIKKRTLPSSARPR